MSTEAERDERAGWAEEVRVAATWQSGPRKRALLNLADRIDPGVESPESPAEEAARLAAEKAEADAQAAREAEEKAQAAREAEEKARNKGQGN